MIKANPKLVSELNGGLLAKVVCSAQGMREYPQAGRSRGLVHQVANLLQRSEKQSAANAGQMRKQAVVDRVVLRAASRIVRDANRQARPLGHLLQLFFEQQPTATIAPTAVAQEQQLVRLGITLTSVTPPPIQQRVGGKAAGVMTNAQVHVSFVEPQVVNAVRDDHALAARGKVVVPTAQRGGAQDPPRTDILAEHFT